MTDQEILKKAIEKAVKNGYRSEHFAIMGSITPAQIAQDLIQGRYKITDNIIFSHDFAKAFWGEEHDWEQVTTFNTECKKCGMVGETGWSVVDRCWESALKQMVLEENPVQYLAKFLEEK